MGCWTNHKCASILCSASKSRIVFIYQPKPMRFFFRCAAAVNFFAVFQKRRQFFRVVFFLKSIVVFHVYAVHIGQIGRLDESQHHVGAEENQQPHAYLLPPRAFRPALSAPRRRFRRFPGSPKGGSGCPSLWRLNAVPVKTTLRFRKNTC